MSQPDTNLTERIFCTLAVLIPSRHIRRADLPGLQSHKNRQPHHASAASLHRSKDRQDSCAAKIRELARCLQKGLSKSPAPRFSMPRRHIMYMFCRQQEPGGKTDNLRLCALACFASPSAFTGALGKVIVAGVVKAQAVPWRRPSMPLSLPTFLPRAFSLRCSPSLALSVPFRFALCLCLSPAPSLTSVSHAMHVFV